MAMLIYVMTLFHLQSDFFSHFILALVILHWYVMSGLVVPLSLQRSNVSGIGAYTIGHFRVAVNLLIKARLSAKAFHLKIGFVCI